MYALIKKTHQLKERKQKSYPPMPTTNMNNTALSTLSASVRSIPLKRFKKVCDQRDRVCRISFFFNINLIVDARKLLTGRVFVLHEKHRSSFGIHVLSIFLCRAKQFNLNCIQNSLTKDSIFLIS